MKSHTSSLVLTPFSVILAFLVSGCTAASVTEPSAYCEEATQAIATIQAPEGYGYFNPVYDLGTPSLYESGWNQAVLNGLDVPPTHAMTEWAEDILKDPLGDHSNGELSQSEQLRAASRLIPEPISKEHKKLLINATEALRHGSGYVEETGEEASPYGLLHVSEVLGLADSELPDEIKEKLAAELHNVDSLDRLSQDELYELIIYPVAPLTLASNDMKKEDSAKAQHIVERWAALVDESPSPDIELADYYWTSTTISALGIKPTDLLSSPLEPDLPVDLLQTGDSKIRFYESQIGSLNPTDLKEPLTNSRGESGWQQVSEPTLLSSYFSSIVASKCNAVPNSTETLVQEEVSKWSTANNLPEPIDVFLACELSRLYETENGNLQIIATGLITTTKDNASDTLITQLGLIANSCGIEWEAPSGEPNQTPASSIDLLREHITLSGNVSNIKLSETDQELIDSLEAADGWSFIPGGEPELFSTLIVLSITGNDSRNYRILDERPADLSQLAARFVSTDDVSPVSFLLFAGS